MRTDGDTERDGDEDSDGGRDGDENQYGDGDRDRQTWEQCPGVPQGGCRDGGFAPSHLLSSSPSPRAGGAAPPAAPPKDTAAGMPAQGWVWERGALPMVVMANGDAAGTRGVAGAHLPEAVGRFLGGRRRLVVGT